MQYFSYHRHYIDISLHPENVSPMLHSLFFFSSHLFSTFRTVYVLSDVLDEQLKALWFSPFQSDEMETEVDMVRNMCLMEQKYILIKF